MRWKNLRGNTPLSMAIEQNQLEIVQLFLQNGADPDVKEAADIRKRTQKRISYRIDELIEQAAVGGSVARVNV